MSERIMLFIPMYNCEKQIVRLLGNLSHQTQTRFEEIVVVNNRSTDNGEQAAIQSLANITGCKTTLLRNRENYGLGGSHKVAFKYALRNNYDYCVVLHGDDQGNISDIFSELDRGEHRRYDCLLNSRFMPGSVRIGYSKVRILGNIVFNLLFSVVSVRWQWDLGSGLCCYSRSFLASGVTNMCSDDLTFNYTLQLHAASREIRQKFFPSTWTEDDQISNVKLVHQTWQMVKILTFYTFNRSGFINVSAGNPAFLYEADIIARQPEAPLALEKTW